MTLKSTYVQGARAARTGLRRVGLLPALDRWSKHSLTGAWARSLLSIYDVEELAALDVPWWTFDSIGRVDAFLAGRRNARVFEWGSGASTIWLSRRAGHVTSVEHDESWASVVRSLLAPGAEVDLTVVTPTPAAGIDGEVRSQKRGARHLDFRQYVNAIDRVGGTFDLIVIDGRARESCLRAALPLLADDGLLVIDNVERSRYRHSLDGLGDDVAIVWTWGLTPGLPYPTRTALVRATRRG